MESLPSAYDSALKTNDDHVYGTIGISYDDGGTQKCRAPYRDDSGNFSVAEFDSADTPSITVNVDVGDSLGSIGFMSVDGTDNHLLYVRANNLVEHNINDGTDVEVLDESGQTLLHLGGTIYDHGGLVVAMTYNFAAGDARYFEFALAAPTELVKDILQSIGVIPFAR